MRRLNIIFGCAEDKYLEDDDSDDYNDDDSDDYNDDDNDDDNEEDEEDEEGGGC